MIQVIFGSKIDVECEPMDENVNLLAKQHKYGLVFIQDDSGNMAS